MTTGQLGLCLLCIWTLLCSVAGHGEEHQLAALPRVKRVISGTPIESTQTWPWLVHFQGKIPKRMFWGIPMSYVTLTCGGSVINKRWILTAAHCFTESGLPRDRMQTPKYWHAQAGEVDSTGSIGKSLKGWIGRIFNKKSWIRWKLHASKIVMHPQYDENDFWSNDIALVKLTEDLPVGPEDPNIGVVNLPDDSDAAWPPPGTDCVMKGWGCTADGGPRSKIAQAATLPVVDTGSCSRIYGSNMGGNRICAGYSNQGTGICKGDSGGPLVSRKSSDPDAPWYQVGIASFTASQNSDNYPAVFTRVSPYKSWIESTIRNN